MNQTTGDKGDVICDESIAELFSTDNCMEVNSLERKPPPTNMF